MQSTNHNIDTETPIYMNNGLNLISEKLTSDIKRILDRCGLMFRLFSRVKTETSIRHKLEVKYADKKVKIQDMIGIRIVVYFQDDIDALALYYSVGDVVRKSIDEYDTSTFRPQRLNITRRIPQEMMEEFISAVPEEYRDIIDTTYEIQIRTVFSEGWHEVEHDLRYKCKEDWAGCESYSRTLNGIIATLETAEWNMKALFNEISRHNLAHSNYSAMLRNKMRLRLLGDGLSPRMDEFLKKNKPTAECIFNADRLVVIYALLTHSEAFHLTYDNLVFLINRIEMMDSELMNIEPEETSLMLDRFLNS